MLVEPAVYWRVLALDYQAQEFEVFHRRPLTRWTHYAGTQVIVWGFLLLTMTWTLGALPVSVLLAAALIAWYVAMDRVVGVVAGADVDQNVSHSVEPVPPVLTGRGFEPFSVYWAKARAAHRVRLLLLNLFYLPLELVSAPRLFAVHVMRAMHRFGWQPDRAAVARSRATAILEAA